MELHESRALMPAVSPLNSAGRSGRRERKSKQQQLPELLESWDSGDLIKLTAHAELPAGAA